MSHLYIVVDIESVSRFYTGMFAIAICAWTYNPETDEMINDEPTVFIMSPTSFDSDAFKFWTDDLERRNFYEKCIQEATNLNNMEVAKKIRELIDIYYSQEGISEVHLVSDFPSFDLGNLNAFLSHYGQHLPIYLKDNKSSPYDEIDYTTMAKIKAGLPTFESASKAFKLLDIERPKRNSNHDPKEDIKLIREEAQKIIYIVNYSSND